MKSCLVIKNDGIGDLVLASGLISDLARHYDGQLDLVTCINNREIAEQIYGLRRVLYVSRDGLRLLPSRFRGQGLKPRVDPASEEAMQTLRGLRYDDAICLRRFIRQSSLVLMQATQAKQKLAMWQFPTNVGLEAAETASVGWQRAGVGHEVLWEPHYYQAVLKQAWGVDVGCAPRLRVTDEATRDPQPMRLGLNFGGNSVNWPSGYWTSLAKSLRSAGWHLTLFGGRDVRLLADMVQKAVPDSLDLVGTTNFAQSVPHLAQLDALIGNDSGFTHFANLVVPRCLVVLGGGTFGRFFPWRTADNQHVIYSGLDCFDCNWQCKFRERYCITKLSVDDVLAYFESMMAGRAPRVLNTSPEYETFEAGWKLLPGRGVALPLRVIEERRPEPPASDQPPRGRLISVGLKPRKPAPPRSVAGRVRHFASRVKGKIRRTIAGV